MKPVVVDALVVAALLAGAAAAWAQDEAAPSAPAPEVPAAPAGQSAPGVTVVQVPGYAPPAQPPAPDVNAGHLPSSARASGDTSRSSDGFDLGSPNASAATVHGGDKGSYLVSGQYVPEIHTVKRGDTLWDISFKYFGHPYAWPRIWSFNKQIQNPHWLYPGDHVRLREGGGVRQVGVGVGFVRLRPAVPSNAVFARNLGFVEDRQEPYWGEIVGSPDDKMMLSEMDDVYVQLDGKHAVDVGQQLTVFEPLDVSNRLDSQIVYVRGTLLVDRLNPKTNLARARIVESLDVIARGAKVGAVDRKIEPVFPVPNEQNVIASIVGSLYPHQFFGRDQALFIDKGSKDGVQVGNRFFVVVRGDEWRKGLAKAGPMAERRAVTDDDTMARVERTPPPGPEDAYPAETYGEVMVVRVRQKTALCLVTAAMREIARDAVLIARKGY